MFKCFVCCVRKDPAERQGFFMYIPGTGERALERINPRSELWARTFTHARLASSLL